MEPPVAFAPRSPSGRSRSASMTMQRRSSDRALRWRRECYAVGRSLAMTTTHFCFGARKCQLSEWRNRRHQNTTNMINPQREQIKINEAGRYPPAYSGLVVGTSSVRTNNEINSSEPRLRSRWTLAPSIGEVPSSSERAACIAPNAKKNRQSKIAGSFFPFRSPWHPIVRWVYSRRSTSASPEHDARDDQHVRHFLDWRKRKCVYLVGSHVRDKITPSGKPE